MFTLRQKIILWAIYTRVFVLFVQVSDLLSTHVPRLHRIVIPTLYVGRLPLLNYIHFYFVNKDEPANMNGYDFHDNT